MRKPPISVSNVSGVRAYEIEGELWYLLVDIRQLLKKPRLAGAGTLKFVHFNRGWNNPVRLRVVDKETFMEYLRMYSSESMQKWRELLAV